MEQKEVRISARIPPTLKRLMREFVSLDSHINESDLIRDSLREKIQRDAPNLYRRVFEESPKHE